MLISYTIQESAFHLVLQFVSCNVQKVNSWRLVVDTVASSPPEALNTLNQLQQFPYLRWKSKVC